MQHGRFETTLTHTEEAVAMISNHGVETGIGSGLADINVALVVVCSGHTVDHPLPVAEVVVGGQDQVVGVAFKAGVLAVNDRIIRKATTINREVRLPVVCQLHVVDTATGTGQENHITVEPVDIEVIAVKALTGPDRGVFKCAGKAGKVAEFSKHLAHVEIGLAASPVIAGGRAVCNHGAIKRFGAVIELHTVVENRFSVGVRLIT